MTAEEQRKPIRNRFQRHFKVLVWKSYQQRLRRWPLLVVETLFAGILFLVAVFTAKPVFLTPLQAEPAAPLTSQDLFASLQRKTYLGYAPNTSPYSTIMARTGALLNTTVLSAPTEDVLNNILYNHSRGTPIKQAVIWVIWKPKDGNVWKFSIRSTEQARHKTSKHSSDVPNRHLRTGFLSVQVAVSQAIVEHSSADTPRFELSLVSMPVSPLMQESRVREVISWILLCFTLALIPPVIETEALVVSETLNGYKRALRLRDVDYSTIYIGWLVYAYLTALPICLLAGITLILIFRWIHLFFALVFILSYISVMIMLALIMAMFHSKAFVAGVWSTLFALLQTFLAELLVHHKYDHKHEVLSYLLNIILPPLGLVHGFNQFALLQTGRGSNIHNDEEQPLSYTIGSWYLIITLYFGLLMLIQRTIGQDRAIGGQVSWKSIIFKKAEDVNKLRPIETPTGRERENLQEVDELVAKAISFRNVSKSIMGVPILNNLTLDIYRGEFTILFAERIQKKMILTLENLLTGLTYADKGTINVLGRNLKKGRNFMTAPHMMGYCHRSQFLIKDLTVQEHLTFFTELCLWHESSQTVIEYGHIRSKRLLRECDLETVRYEYIKNLDPYYRAQLCWAIAVLLEPRIIILPNFTDVPKYVAVIKDKIMQYRNYITIVKSCFTSIQLEYGDRVFLFDNTYLIFGGTPAYMFFKYGREYRVRMTLRAESSLDEENTNELIERANAAGATVRAHLGSLLVLKLPAHPTSSVAALVKELTDNAVKYGITSMNISLPDSEEVCRRAINELRAPTYETTTLEEVSKEALKRIAEPVTWKRKKSNWANMMHIRSVGWKFITFYKYYRLSLIVTIMSALVSGVLIGTSLSTLLSNLDHDRVSRKTLQGDVLTVESLEQKTTLVLRTDNSSDALSVANGYVLSHTKATDNEIMDMVYTALLNSESLTEYLVTRAIDSPQHYVYMYAYGIDVSSNNGVLVVQALYSPLHHDHGAAARSLARAYMALLRHYTGALDASIEIVDDPLILDLTPWMRHAAAPPLLIQFLLILTISHITLIPSKEHGLIRHMQSNAINFSPMRYWFTLYFCDLILYWMLVALMALVMICIVYLVVQSAHFQYSDLFVLPFMLMVYGFGCVPQAYLFSLGPRAALNLMTFINVNIVFAKCGVMQSCFERKPYISQYPGVLMEIIAILCTSAVYMTLLLLWEYKLIQRGWMYATTRWVYPDDKVNEIERPGVQHENKDVLDKKAQLKIKNCQTVDTFGEYLLADNVTRRDMGVYTVRNVSFGLAKGETLALSGLKRHGRISLIEMLAGYKLPSEGNLWTKSKWSLMIDPHMYARQITISCKRQPVPPWMCVSDSLELLALLRGVPKKHVADEVRNYIEALELHEQANTPVNQLASTDCTRLHFAAAVIGAPPVIILDECTAYQKFTVRRAMYCILYHLKKRGHAIFISSGSVENHMPMTNRLAIMLDGRIYDIDSVDNLVERYSYKGYTVVVHLKDEVNMTEMFAKYFSQFIINDVSEVLVNIQVLDKNLDWATVFEKMETLQARNQQVYSYIITAIPIDYIYNSIISNDTGHTKVEDRLSCNFLRFLASPKHKRAPTKETVNNLRHFKQKYDITKVKELPWSVIFQR